jgi:aspartyl-tRNA(Asn)/glutamyl-tRNA(Gln) amidotransferase subunit A
MTNPSDDISRRSFLKATLAGTAISWANVSALPEAGENSQRTNPVSGNHSDDLTKLSIREASDQIRKKKVSPVELTKACLARIDRANPALNAFITITAESALQQAREAEAEVARGKWRGPLHGVPIALKDLFDTAGVRTTAGSGVFKDRIPTEDAEVVRRLKAAGAVLLGKTNMHEFAYGGTSVVSYFGAVHNPWDINYIAGGSSGGSAAAVAAELCYGALGSDTGGSIREPASYCSIVGLKPTYGLVSTRGVIPLSWSLDHVGPITRTVADAAVLLQAIAGYDPAEITSQQMPVPEFLTAINRNASMLRLGIARDFFFAGLNPEVEEAINEALSVLKRLTASLTEVKIPVSADSSVLRAEAYAYHAEFVSKTPELYQSWTLERIRTGAEVTSRAYIEGLREIAEFRRSTQRMFESVDAIVTPTASTPPRTIMEANADLPTKGPVIDLRNTAPFDRNGLPTISIPCGFTTSGLPIGLQISGPLGGEAVVLQLAHAYEQATEWHKRRPQASESASAGA